MYSLLKIRTKNSLKMTKNRQKTPIWGTLLGHSRIAEPLLFQDIPHFGHKKRSSKIIREPFVLFFRLIPA
jgi:hypothetical protein